MDASKCPNLTTKVLGVLVSLAMLAAAVILAMLATTAFVNEQIVTGSTFGVLALAIFVASEVLRRRATARTV